MKRRAFTLVELLVTVVIIGILAAITLGAIAGARTSAMVSGTRSTIAMIDAAVMDRYESYLTRRIGGAPASVRPENNDGDTRPLKRWMVNARHDLMRMEMPDRWSDVTGDPLAPGFPRPPLSSLYLRRYNRAVAAHGVGAVNTNASAECLYLICMNGPLSDTFQEWQWGDVDGDGLREFLDKWGKPIRFIRWPAGFTQQRAGLSDPESPPHFDPDRLIDGQYMTYPLIYSAGPDGVFDINRGTDGSGNTMAYALVGGNLRPCDPDPNGLLVGVPADDDADGNLNHYDNVHNHDLELR